MSSLVVTRQDDETLTLTVTDPDTGDPVDITGGELTFLVKRDIGDDDADALVTKTVGDGIGIADQIADTGQATVTIASADTDGIEPGVYPWELQAVLAASVKTLARGRIRIARDLVRTA